MANTPAVDIFETTRLLKPWGAAQRLWNLAQAWLYRELSQGV